MAQSGAERTDRHVLRHSPERGYKDRNHAQQLGPEAVPPEDRFSRASVTAWMVMALESGRLSGFDVPEKALAGAKRMTDANDKDSRMFL